MVAPRFRLALSGSASNPIAHKEQLEDGINAGFESLYVGIEDTRGSIDETKGEIEEVRQLAFDQAKVFATVSEGMAATDVGQTFSVRSTNPDIAQYVYRHDAGSVSTLLAETPSVQALSEKATQDVFETLSPVTFMIVDPQGKVAAQYPEPALAELDQTALKIGVFETLDPSPLLILGPDDEIQFRQEPEIGGDAGPDPIAENGPSSALWRLRQTRSRTALRDLDEAATFVVTLIGDSFFDIAYRMGYAVARRLALKYGDAGGGWLGFASGQGNARPDLYAMTVGSGWASTNRNQPTPALGVVTAVEAGQLITVTGPAQPVLSSVTLVAIGGNGVVRYRWNGGGWTSLTLDGDGVRRFALTGLPASGAWGLEIESVSGTCVLSGLDMRSAVSGARVNDLGNSGTASNNWTAPDASQWQSSIAALNSDLIIIQLGTNDQGGNRTPGEFRASMETIVTRCRAASPAADLLIVSPPENQRGLPVLMKDLAVAARSVADDLKCAFVDLQPFFGDQATDYANGSPHPWFETDNLHPNATGARIGASVITRLIENA